MREAKKSHLCEVGSQFGILSFECPKRLRSVFLLLKISQIPKVVFFFFLLVATFNPRAITNTRRKGKRFLPARDGQQASHLESTWEVVFRQKGLK